jgi:hypothetical protein
MSRRNIISVVAMDAVPSSFRRLGASRVMTPEYIYSEPIARDHPGGGGCAPLHETAIEIGAGVSVRIGAHRRSDQCCPWRSVLGHRTHSNPPDLNGAGCIVRPTIVRMMSIPRDWIDCHE